MVVFLAHSCPHCNAEIPVLIDWMASGGLPEGIQIMGVPTAVSRNAVNYPPDEWLAGRGWPWPVLVDESSGDGGAGTAAEAFGATAWPYLVIIGADGLVKVRATGEQTIDELTQLVSAALGT